MIRRLTLALLWLGAASAAQADSLTVTKTATVISDPLNDLNPRSLPGSVVDYKVVFTNPLGNAGKPVRSVQVDDPLPPNVVLRVSDLTSGKGPIEFLDGSLLGLGLLGSGLSCSFVSLADATDCIDFSNGVAWGYVPVPDSNGYDPNVRAIRVRPVTTFATGGSFQLRYRVRIR